MVFCGFDLHAAVPDHSEHCRFRNALVTAGVFDDFLAETCLQIEGHVLKLREAGAAIINATLIESAARPRQYIEPVCDREEGEDGNSNIVYSADDEARWVNKGLK